MLTPDSILPPNDETWPRIRMTTSCTDCEAIPKVANAGQIIVQADQSQSYQLMHNGVRVIAGGYFDLWMAVIIQTLKGHHEPQEEKAFHEILKHISPNATMIELGAFWGYYSMWFQKAIPGAVNNLVEPEPRRAALGKKNFALNGMHATFIEAFIGAVSREKVPFRFEAENVIRDSIMLSVDDLIDSYHIDHVEMLHADIQGAELAMLEGSLKSIDSGKIRFVFISTHHHSLSDDPIIHYKCLDLIKQHGGHIILSHTVSESYSGDGLIVASFFAADQNIIPIQVSRNLASSSLFRETEFDLAELQAHYKELATVATNLTAEVAWLRSLLPALFDPAKEQQE